MVRLLDMDGRLPRGLDFFAENLAPLKNSEGRVRVLLAGAADTGLPALIGAAVRQSGGTPSLLLVDRCLTTVTLNRRFAEISGMDFTVCQGQLDAIDADSVDAVVTHNVMGFNSDADRAAILKSAAKTLRPGGRLLSIEFLAETRPPRKPDQTALLQTGFEERLRQRGMDEDVVLALSAAAGAYWSTDLSKGAYPIPRAGCALILTRLVFISAISAIVAIPSVPLLALNRESRKGEHTPISLQSVVSNQRSSDQRSSK